MADNNVGSVTDAVATGADVLDEYDAEVRFGVVMYGGVSLAIYINGVANEMYELACSTPRDFGPGDAATGGTRRVYQDLSRLLSEPTLRQPYLDWLANRSGPNPLAVRTEAVNRTRFIVDVIAGTSAGGINGIFLAKALANGESFGGLKKLWIEEGDIGSLLNDRHSFEGLAPLTPKGAPRSLLNSERMYLKLYDAMAGLTPVDALRAPVRSGAGTVSRVAERLDLYITTTDIRGSTVPLRLFDRVVQEKRYKQVYHLEYANEGAKNDLTADNVPFLAFTARCTSSFPFAFEPMQLCVVGDILNRSGKLVLSNAQWAERYAEWRHHFRGLEPEQLEAGRHVTLAFGDGGYLDNKPFSYAVEALSWRQGDLPIQRKLIYVEPAPERMSNPLLAEDVAAARPDAIENALAALTSIPRYETIREDLEAVLKRNRRIERVERIVRRVEHDIDADEAARQERMNRRASIEDWTQLGLAAIARLHGPAYLPYLRLRLVSVTDDLAERLARMWGVDTRSDHLYALRALVRAWREDRFAENPGDAQGRPTVMAFLDDYDLEFRVRAQSMLLRRTHQISRLLRARAALTGGTEALAENDRHMLALLNERGLDIVALDDARAEACEQGLGSVQRSLEEALAQLARVTYGTAPAARSAEVPPQARAGLRTVLDFVLGSLDDNKPFALVDEAGKPVPVKFPMLEAPASARTLQEQVFARAKRLYEEGKQRKVVLQQMLIDQLDGFARGAREAAEWSDPALISALGMRRFAWVNEHAHVEVADTGLPERDTPDLRIVRQVLADYHERFDEFDQVSFPLYYDTGTGEPSTVDIIRVSPRDAVALVDESKASKGEGKLAGTALANFGAFLDQRWRRNDLMWGRLDGAERLITALLPTGPDAELRRALIREAQTEIAREELTPQGHAELTTLMLKALAETGQQDTDAAFAALCQGLAPTDAERQKRTLDVLRSLLKPADLVQHLAGGYQVDRRLDAKQMMSTASRALTIAGKVVEGVAAAKNVEAPALRWIARAGLVGQSVLAVAWPDTMRWYLFRHWMALLYLFGGVVLLGSIVFSAPEVRTFAGTLLGVTAAAHLGVAVLHERFGGRDRLRKALVSAVVVLVLVLTALGVRTVWKALFGG